jgi:hypothetical protein
MSRLGKYLPLAAIAISCSGCDPVRTASQPITIRIVDSSTGKILPDAQVRVKLDFDRAHPLSEETQAPAEEWHKHRREYWEQSPWYIAPTGANGEARVVIATTSLDRTRGAEPPPMRDVVTGEPYLVRVVPNGGPEETLSVVMQQGAQAQGEKYTVSVIEIGKPSYTD